MISVTSSIASYHWWKISRIIIFARCKKQGERFNWYQNNYIARQTAAPVKVKAMSNEDGIIRIGIHELSQTRF